MRFIRNAIVATIVCFLGAVTPVHARTTASYGQNAVGTSCNNVAKAADFDAIAQCNSGTGAGTMQTAPIIVGTVTAPPYSDTTCDSSKAGMIQWTGTAFQGCDGSSWIDLGGGSSSTCTPDAFSFTDQTDVALDTTITSNSVVLGGDNFTCVSIISCPSCTALYKNGASVSTAGTAFIYGDSISITQQSSSSLLTTTSAEITAGPHSTTWSITTTSDPCEFAAPTIGVVCDDGSIYAGLSPDGNIKMFTTPCDQGRTGTQGACTGTRSTYQWGTYDVVTGYTSVTDGDGNTAGLVANYSTYNDGHTMGVPAAQACAGLTAHGHSDWYLPALDELDVLYDSKSAIGGFDISGPYYWSSSERSISNVHNLRFLNGYQNSAAKFTTSLYTRCVRHN